LALKAEKAGAFALAFLHHHCAGSATRFVSEAITIPAVRDAPTFQTTCVSWPPAAPDTHLAASPFGEGLATRHPIPASRHGLFPSRRSLDPVSGT